MSNPFCGFKYGVRELDGAVNLLLRLPSDSVYRTTACTGLNRLLMQTDYKGVSIRTVLKSGDIGYLVYLHGWLYKKEYNYGIPFEAYVAKGFYEFYSQYDEQKDCVWICEHNNSIVGFLLLMHRENNAAQLRYFLLVPQYRGIGLGRKLMELCMQWLKSHNYQSAYLWTTHEQTAAAALYKKFGFKLTEEFDSVSFGKPLMEQRYDLISESFKP